MAYRLRILESVEEMAAVEELQRRVWSGSETDVVPGHLLITAVHNGGLVVGAYAVPVEPPEQAEPERWPAPAPDPASLVGIVFGFPGLYYTPDGPRPKHCSHILAVLPAYRDQGVGFALKRAQWQMVRHQGLDCITWTFDPLLSRNAYLNIGKLGGVCNTYVRNAYGDMRDDLNAGLPSDRFQVDWWVNSQRVNHRLSKRARPPLDLGHFLSAGVQVLNPAAFRADGWPEPAGGDTPAGLESEESPLLLVEIPADFMALKTADPGLASAWRLHTRALFEDLFARGYLVSDSVFLDDPQPRSFYVLVHGETTL